MKRRALIHETILNCWLRKNAADIYNGKCNIDELSYFFHVFSTNEVARITGREASTVRHAKKRGSLFGVKKGEKYFFNMWEIKRCFPVRKRVNKKWADGEISELITSGTCNGRSMMACKTMMSKIKNGIRQS